MKKTIYALMLIPILSGCSTFGNIQSNNNQNNTPTLIAPPLPRHSTCEQGKLESIVISEDGTARVWYYNNNNFLSVSFASGVNVRLTRASDSAFCYDYF